MPGGVFRVRRGLQKGLPVSVIVPAAAAATPDRRDRSPEEVAILNRPRDHRGVVLSRGDAREELRRLEQRRVRRQQRRGDLQVVPCDCRRARAIRPELGDDGLIGGSGRRLVPSDALDVRERLFVLGRADFQRRKPFELACFLLQKFFPGAAKHVELRSPELRVQRVLLSRDERVRALLAVLRGSGLPVCVLERRGVVCVPAEDPSRDRVGDGRGLLDLFVREPLEELRDERVERRLLERERRDRDGVGRERRDGRGVGPLARSLLSLVGEEGSVLGDVDVGVESRGELVVDVERLNVFLLLLALFGLVLICFSLSFFVFF